MAHYTPPRLLRSGLAALATTALIGGAGLSGIASTAVANTTASTLADPDKLCGVTFTTGGYEGGSAKVVNGVYQGTRSLDMQKWGDKVDIQSPQVAGYYTNATINLAIPDGCTVGNQAWVDMPNGFHVRGAGFTDLTDSAGNSVAKVRTDVTPGREHYSSRLVFTFTDGVDASRNITGTYSFQFQEGRDKGIAPLMLLENVTMEGSDGSHINPITWQVRGDYYGAPVFSAGWNGDADTPTGYVYTHSYPSFTGTDDVDILMEATGGYDWKCDSATNQDNNQFVGIGLVDVGSEVGSMPTGATLLDPSKYTLECDESRIHIHMPASSWTSADAQTGQILRVVVRRIANGDDSWKPNGGVFGLTTLKQTGHEDRIQQRWWSPAPGSSASASGIELKTVEAIPAPALTTDPACGKRPTVVTTPTEGITWKTSLSEDGNTATVTARAKAGFYIPASVKSSWKLTVPKAVPCAVDATWAKTWDDKTQSWVLAVSNPSSEADTKPVTLTDSVTLTDAAGKTTALAGEAVTGASAGTVNGASWSVPALKPAQTATATVKADWKWLAGNGGTLTNHLGKSTDSACPTATKASATCAISTVKIPVDAQVNKTWNAKTQTWTLTVTNPASDRSTHPVTLTDDVTVRDSKGNLVDVDGEQITNPTVGTINDGTWQVPALKPGQTATATVKAKAQWLAGDGGTLINHFGATGSTCLTNTSAKDSASCAVTETLIPVDATWVKTWDADKQEWALTVSNPAKDRPTRPVTLTDAVTILDADGHATDIKDEAITNPSLGTVDGDTWTIPAIPAGGKATATVKAKGEWLAGNGGSVVNRLAKAGDKKCPAAMSASAHCAISTVAVDVDPVVSKSWDKDTHAWTVTVSNPSEDRPARSVTIRDNLTLKGKDGAFTDVEGEEASHPTGGSVDGATWVTPTLQPGESASVLVKAKDEWLTGDGQLVNRAGIDGAKCVTDPASDLDSCAEAVVAQTPAPAPEAVPEAPAVALAKTGVNLTLAALSAAMIGTGAAMLARRRKA